MSNLVFHPSTLLQIERTAQNLPQGMLLSGPEGVGLLSAAQYMCGLSDHDVTVLLPERKEVVDVEQGTITVQSIRRLYQTSSGKGKKRVVIIDRAERMGKAAQNAFLKLLEEPNEATHFILLSHQPQTLLPTITSRVQKLEVRKISREQSELFLDSLSVRDKDRRAQLLFMAEGLPAALTRLQDEEYFAIRAGIVRDARSYILGTPYDRTLIAHTYKDNRSHAVILLRDVLQLLTLTMKAKHDASLISRIESCIRTYDRIEANGNIRLHLATAFS